MIAHTQPRRIAARSVAERIAQELGAPLGGPVGYQVRFTDHSSAATRLKVMTDGVLLAQIQQDPQLRAYDAIIIDEAHERSLNIDFLLGYISNLLPKRPDLKVVITSATIDSELFAAHFGAPGRPAPVVHVTGRTYPVEVRYRPPGAAGVPEDQPAAIAHAARELLRAGDGDILVFCSGEREIRDAAEALAADLGAISLVGGSRAAAKQRHPPDAAGPGDGAGQRGSAGSGRQGGPPDAAGPGDGAGQRGSAESGRQGGAPDAAGPGDGIGQRGSAASGRQGGPPDAAGVAGGIGQRERGWAGSAPGGIEVLPLYSRLSAAEQHRVFERHGRRRIVLATNVAETSLTVPGIHYVIDPGTARISRYSKATKVQRLPIEPISQASANQRAGRCGRIARGVCIRLYSEADFAARDEFTEPEILRTSLAAVILQMIAVGVARSPGDVARFPFVQPPDARGVADGVKLLEELAAITSESGRTKLTEVGWALARIPLDPRLGRMVVEAAQLGVEREVAILVAALTIQDPRERPLDAQAQADQAHARFTDPASDFLGLLNLWEYLREQRAGGSSSAFRRLVRSEYLNYLRIREWQDLVKEVRRAARAALAASPAKGAKPAKPAKPAMAAQAAPAAKAAKAAGTGGAAVAAQAARVGTAGQTAKAAKPAMAAQAAPAAKAAKAAGTGGAAVAAQAARVGTAGQKAKAPPGEAAPCAPPDQPGGAAGWRRVWPADLIHRALLTGLLSQIGMLRTADARGQGPDRRKAGRAAPGAPKGRGEYQGARGVKFAIHPGSALKRKPPAWLMAAELVETSRLWARGCAAINPEWVEAAAPHLARRTYAEPRWSAKRGQGVITERVLVYGLPVVAGRVVALAPVDPALARELFIRHALVQGEWTTHHRFYQANRDLLERVEELAARSRSSSHAISEPDLFDFYDRRIPDSAVSTRHFDAWWKKAGRATPDLLTLTAEGLAEGALEARAGFPDQWRQGPLALPLTYEYAPGAAQDGVTCHIPVQYANQVRPAGFDWQVPGLRQDLVAALIKGLPKPHRAELLPARDTARQAVERLGEPADWLGPDGQIMPLTSALTKVFADLRGVGVPGEAWAPQAVPAHLRINFQIEDPSGRVMAAGPDLRAAVARATPEVSAAIQRVVAASERPRPPGPGAAAPPPRWQLARDGLTTWDFGDLPAEVAAEAPPDAARPPSAATSPGAVRAPSGPSLDAARAPSAAKAPGAVRAPADQASAANSAGAGLQVRGYPALVPRSGGVDLKLLTSAAEAAAATPVGVRELLLGELALPTGRLTSRLAPAVALPLAASRYPSVEALARDAQAMVVDAAVARAGLPRTQAAYQELRAALRDSLEDQAHQALVAASGLVALGRQIEADASRVRELAVLNSVVDIKDHLAALLGAGFLTRAGRARLADLRRYLKGDEYRLPRLGLARAREEQALWLLGDLRQTYEAALAAAGAPTPPALAEIPWMLEELRISLLAQPLGTAYPVSEKRVRRALGAARASRL
ncbi:MAG: DUF3418 domain-containing protein [Bifidobacteriaceae bacterium]|nr:DUF3418 domain-containing protein [Bifidobacteriaceae bacterium]